MRAIHYTVAAVVVLAGLTLGAFLVPRESEMALIKFKDRDYGAALAAYEKRLRTEALTPSVVMPLTQLYLQYGRVAEATELMERYLQVHPDDQEARERLGKYYQYGQRPAGYTENLEKLAAEHPTEQRLRELLSIYNLTGRFEARTAALKRLTDMFPDSEEDFHDLAAMQASAARYSEAADTLARLGQLFPASVTTEIVELHVSLLLDAGRKTEAEERAERWLQRRPNPEIAARFAGLFRFKGSSDRALAILQPFDKASETAPPVLSEIIQLQLEAGRSDLVLERLTRLFESGKMPVESAEPLVDLLLTKGNTPLAAAVAESVSFRSIPDWLLANLVDASLAIGSTEVASRLTAAVGDSFLDASPLLGARLAAARRDNGEVRRWLSRAEATDLSVPDRIGAADLYVQLDDSSDAIRVLRPLADAPGAPESAIVQLAGLYLDSKDAGAGLPLLESVRARRDSPAIAEAWSMLAALAGKEDAVVRWLAASPARAPSIQTLTDLYFIAQDNRQGRLALAASQRLFERQPSENNRLKLAEALMDGGRPYDALGHFRILLSPGSGGASEERYAAALSAARDEGYPVTDELRTYWSRKLGDPSLPEAGREEILLGLLDTGATPAILPDLERLARQKGGEWFQAYLDAAVKAGRTADLAAFLRAELERPDRTLAAKEPYMFALMDHAATEESVPYLRRYADEAGGSWVFAYEEALEKLNRTRELRDFWIARAGRPAAVPAERMEIASRLLDLGAKSESERILMEIGAGSPPDSPAVGQLLFLWGSRPPSYGIDWLAERVQRAPPEQRSAWLEHLMNSGAAARAARLAADKPEAMDAYIRALVAINDGPALADVLKTRLGATNDPAALRRYARYALETGEPATARAYFARLAAALPEDAEALRWLGALTFADGQWEASEHFLERYFATGMEDYESSFYYGELSLRRKNSTAARLYFERAMREIERSPNKTFGMRAVRAQLLDRLGRRKESVTEFEALLRERPADKDLRADYASLLLRSGQLEDAERVLSTP